MKRLFFTALAFAAFSLMAEAAGDQKSFKRGFGENQLYYVEDLKALLPGNSWYYDWGVEPQSQVAQYVGKENGLEFIPMIWNGNYDVEKLRAYYKAHPEDRTILGFNEPNFPDQAALLPSEAAEKWRSLEELAKELNLTLVGPAMNYAGSPLKDGKTWGPYEWMDAFIAAYKEKYGTEPHYDYTAVHAYMDRADAVMSLVDGFAEKYGKKVWLTEFCAWESQSLTAEQQQEYMIAKLRALELSDNVYRYAWFKARNANKYPYYNLLYYPTKTIKAGTLTDLGFAYVHMSTFDRTKFFDLNEAIPANSFVDCNLKRLQESADPRARVLDKTELYLGANNLSATYQVNVPEAGTYKLIVRYAREEDDLKSRINVLDANGNTLASRIELEPTKGWTNYVAKTIDVTLPAGQQSITIKKASFAPVALSMLKLVSTVDPNDKDMQTLTGDEIVKLGESGSDNPGDNPTNPGANESYDKEVVVSDDAYKFDANNKYYAIYLDGTTQHANVSADRFVNLGDNGGSQNSYSWENTFSFGEASGKNSFGVEGEYKSLVVADKGWSGFGYNVNSSKGDLDLSHINKDYKLHLALKAEHNYPLCFTINDGSGHAANLVFGQYDLDGKRPVADFKRDGKWHSIDLPVSYLHRTFGIDFSKDTDYEGNLLVVSAGGTQGVKVDFDAVFFYGPKNSQPDNYDANDSTLVKTYVSNDAYKFSDDERYYVVYLDDATRSKNLDDEQVVDCGPNGSSRNLYPWENTCSSNNPTDKNSFGEPGSYMSWTQKGGWFGLGYNVGGSTNPLNLSAIDKDYRLHFAVRTTYTGSILFSTTDAAGKSGNIVLGKEAYHDHEPLADFERDGKWHSIDIPVNLLNINDGLNFASSSNYTGNIFSIVMAGADGVTIDYDAVFFHGPKTEAPYADITVDNKGISIAKANEKPFAFSKDEHYYIVTLDDDTKKENLSDDQITDIGPDEQTRHLYPWENTVISSAATGGNSFGVEGGYTSWTVGDKGWSGLGFSVDRAGLTNLAGIESDYSLHFAVKSTTTQSVEFIVTDGNGKAAYIVLGKDSYDGHAAVGDFDRDDTWTNVDVPMSWLIRQGLDFRPAKAYGGNIISVLCGTKSGDKVDYDAIFFHGKKNTTNAIESVSDDADQTEAKLLGIYDLSGRKVSNMNQPGIYIMRTTKGARKVLVK